MKYQRFIENLTIEQCQTIYKILCQYDYDDSITHGDKYENFGKWNEWDKNDFIEYSFYIYGMESNDLFVFGHYNTGENELHVICHDQYYLDMVLEHIEEYQLGYLDIDENGNVITIE